MNTERPESLRLHENGTIQWGQKRFNKPKSPLG